MRSKIYIAIGLLGVGLLAAVAPNSAGAATSAPPGVYASSDDLAAVSALTGLSAADASSFAGLQAAVESIGSELSVDSAVTSFWIEPTRGGVLVIGLRNLGASSTVLASLPVALRPETRFVQQQFSEAELGAAASAVAGTYAEAGIPAYGSVDVRAQQASVTLDQKTPVAALPTSIISGSTTAIDGGVPVTVRVGDVPTPAATIYAGLVGTLCTTGFTVVHTSGNARSYYSCPLR